MKTISFLRKAIALNLLSRVLFMVIFGFFTLLASCEKEKLGDECDHCKLDSDCKASMTCELFKNVTGPFIGAPSKRCATSSTQHCN